MDTRFLDSETARRTSCCRWLNILGACLFIVLTILAHQENSSPFPGDAGGYRTAGVPFADGGAGPTYYRVIKDASTKYALDPKLIATIIYIESGGNEKAVSPKGAKGLMQITPAVYQKYDVEDPFDIEQNIFIGTAYLAFLLRKFDGNLEHALAAYNCGPTRVLEYNGLPPIRETKEYVKRVMDYYLRGEVPTGPIDRES